MDFGKDEVTVSSAITPPLYCFLLKVNAATGSEKKTKKQHICHIGLLRDSFKADAEQSGSENSSPGFIHGKSPHGKTTASLQHKPYKA